MKMIYRDAAASDITHRAAESGLGGHYEPNQPGATSLRDARALWIDGQHVTAEVHGRTITIFLGCKILFQGELPEEITERFQVNPWVAATALAGSPVRVQVRRPAKITTRPKVVERKRRSHGLGSNSTIAPQPLRQAGIERRDGTARKCGYRDWEHLIKATCVEPASDIAAMTGYSMVTINLWRRRLLG